MDHLHLTGAQPAAITGTPQCPDCSTRPAKVRGLCDQCYRNWRKRAIRNGTFTKIGNAHRPLRDRLLEKTTPGHGGCIIWTANLNNRGYGTIGEGGKGGRRLYAHRVSYTLFIGAIPAGLVVDHTCHNEDESCSGGPECLHRRCINPRHLEAVTSEENIRRSAASAVNRTQCVNGHPFDEDNTYVRLDTGTRQCRQCSRDRATRSAVAR
ncbi:HNH endonuclease signature motif containing protein [Streptomyces sp. MCL20-2]|uniref:HNH endonuclease signature motif containing protein n=1 Tax=Streptomyces sp. MCL20-2 TaxID=2967219 RepID=UPI0029677B3C|nr:HNH endonuclease signature motif containing protein [Streptomyces sp. MCL20-2]